MTDDELAALARATKNITEALPAIMQYERLKAKVHRAKYLALIAEGFNDAQAIEICKQVMNYD